MSSKYLFTFTVVVLRLLLSKVNFVGNYCRDTMSFFMTRAFWLALTIRAFNHSSDRFISLLLPPSRGISSTWGGG